MSSNRPKSLSELMSSESSPLGQLANKAAGRLALADFLRTGLTDELGSHLVGANLREEGCLVILADDPQWAALLRYESGNLLSRARERHPALTSIRIRVARPG